VECPYIPQLAYGDFSKRLHEKAVGQRIPISGSIELTFRCNLRCQHCYVAHGHNGLPGKQELTTADHFRLLDEIADEGTLWLLLTGGDPLVRRDFSEIWMYAKRKGFLLSLFTNGTLITPQIADLLAEWLPFTVEITLYGHTQATYERVTGIPGSHARCRRGIDLLLERNIPLKLKTVLMTLNHHELEQMSAYSDSLGLSFRFDPMLNAGFDCNRAPVNLRLSPQQIVELDLADEKRLQAWKEFTDRFMGVRGDECYIYSCGAGIQSFHVDPHGQLSVCMISRAREYDWKGGTFHDGWTRFIPQVRYELAEKTYPCSHCGLKALCDRCPGWAELEYGDPLAPVEYLCQVARQRAEKFSFIKMEKIV
jgi:radical SAM protein with 4Fe4S-binding SPASM domain